MIDKNLSLNYQLQKIKPIPFKEHDWRIGSLALDIAGSCNLSCRYCAEAATQPVQRCGMSEKVLDKAIDLLMDNSHNCANKSIRIGSGEPMMAKNLLSYLRKRLNKISSSGRLPPKVFITTNGTLIDSEIRNWLVNSDWNIKISLDGPADIHDRWRIDSQGNPTYQIVAEAVRDLAIRTTNRFSSTAVLCKGTDPSMVFNAIAELGVQRIEMIPACHPDTKILPSEYDFMNYRAFVLNYAEEFINGKKYLPALVRIYNIARRVMGYDLKRVVCGAGRSFFGVGPSGKLYPCFRFIGINSYCLGDLEQGLSRSHLETFRNGAGKPYDRREDCEECNIAPLCGGTCFAEAELMGPGDGKPFPLHCNYIRADAEASIMIVQELKNRDPERLLVFFKDIIEL